MDDHAGRKSTCGREMGNNEFSWSGLIRYRPVVRVICDVVSFDLRCQSAICNSYNMGTFDLPEIYTLALRTLVLVRISLVPML